MVCLISGGNIDVNILNRVITRGLVMSGRKANLTIALEDKPGQLERVPPSFPAAAAMWSLSCTMALTPTCPSPAASSSWCWRPATMPRSSRSGRSSQKRASSWWQNECDFLTASSAACGGSFLSKQQKAPCSHFTARAFLIHKNEKAKHYFCTPLSHCSMNCLATRGLRPPARMAKASALTSSSSMGIWMWCCFASSSRMAAKRAFSGRWKVTVRPNRAESSSAPAGCRLRGCRRRCGRSGSP
mgnify:CR=1 FL=1